MIIQGDVGTVLKIHINENNSPIDLTSANIQVTFKTDTGKFTKTATVTGTGLSEVEFTAEDLKDAGRYYIQANVTYPDDSSFSTDIQQFTVESKL